MGGALCCVGVVWALGVHTPKYGMVAGSAAYTTSSSGTGVVSCGMWGGTSSARNRVGTPVTVVSIALAFGTLGVGVQAQVAFSSIG